MDPAARIVTAETSDHHDPRNALPPTPKRNQTQQQLQAWRGREMDRVAQLQGSQQPAAPQLILEPAQNAQERAEFSSPSRVMSMNAATVPPPAPKKNQTQQQLHEWRSQEFARPANDVS